MRQTYYENDSVEDIKADLLETVRQLRDPDYHSGPHWWMCLSDNRTDMCIELARRWFGRPS